MVAKGTTGQSGWPWRLLEALLKLLRTDDAMAHVTLAVPGTPSTGPTAQTAPAPRMPHTPNTDTHGVGEPAPGYGQRAVVRDCWHQSADWPRNRTVVRSDPPKTSFQDKRWRPNLVPSWREHNAALHYRRSGTMCYAPVPL